MPDYRLWATSVPGPGATTEDVPLNLATQFNTSASVPLWLKGISYWKPDANMDGAIQVHAWEITGPGAGTLVAGSQQASPVGAPGTWVDVLYATPIPLALASDYQAAVLFPSGYCATADYWSSGPGAAGITSGPLSAPNAAGSTGGGRQGSLDFSTIPAYPQQGSANAASYWVQPIVTDEDPSGVDVRDASAPSTLSLVSSAAGVKSGAAAGSSTLTLGGAAAGGKVGVSAAGSVLAVASAASAGKTAGATASSALTLGSTAITDRDEVEAVDSPVLCAPWATPADVSPRDRERLNLTDAELEPFLLRASELLWALSGRRWLGAGCQDTAVLRSEPPQPGGAWWPYSPSWGSCACWGWSVSGSVRLALASQWERHVPRPVAVKLPRNTVTAVTAVTVGGLPFDAWEFARNGWITRTDGQGWGVCDGDTMITYSYGQAPPSGGRMAAVELAVELALHAGRAKECRLPARTTSVTRQGISMEILDPMEFLNQGGVGLYAVDLWLRSVNPDNRGHAATVWSPDLPTAMRM